MSDKTSVASFSDVVREGLASRTSGWAGEAAPAKASVEPGKGVQDIRARVVPGSMVARRQVPGRIGTTGRQVWAGERPPDLCGDGPAMREIRRQIEAVAPANSTVLVCGETGTGKGVVACALHARSPRRERRLLHVDCAALSPALIESELFGHERGAFTGATARRSGRLELVGDGTLFLDEIGELAPELQAKLLRVLEDREYERVGGTRTLRMRARVVAATNRDLACEVREGRFRADLFYRLDLVTIRVPPLRERLEDLPLLVCEGLSRLERTLGRTVPQLSASLVERLQTHPWPGNVRELFNLLERLVIHNSGPSLGPDALDGLLDSTVCVEQLRCGRASAAAASSRRIASALRASGGNVAKAARLLGLPRSTLRYRIRRYLSQDSPLEP